MQRVLLLVLLLFSAVSSAAEGDAPGEDGAEEIVVWGELAVERARQELMRTLAAEGYDRVIEREDYILMRSASPWKGEIRIYDDGWVRMKRQPVQFRAPKTPWGRENSAGAWAGCILYPFACIRTGGQLVSKARLDSQKGRALSASENEVSAYGDRVADRETGRRVNDVPELLGRLWEQGIGVDGETVYATNAERRQAILDYWDSRTDTEWGDAVREAIEAFVMAEVQTSSSPFTAEELKEFQARQRSTRVLSLAVP